jgi:hypothetical protein
MKAILAAIAAAFILYAPTVAEAGCRCGDSSIAEWKTCHQKVCNCPNCDFAPAGKHPKGVGKKAPPKRAPKEPEWKPGRVQQKTVSREDGEDHTYPWVILYQKHERRTETLSELVDCNDGTICALKYGCYFDTNWQVVAPDTVGGWVVYLGCGKWP